MTLEVITLDDDNDDDNGDDDYDDYDIDDDVVVVSSDRSSYSDGGLLYIYIDPQPLFEISSISANIFSFSF